MVAAELLEEVRELGDRFTATGRRLYLVGGVVRDQLLGLPLAPDADLDLTTDARPDEVKELVGPLARAIWTQGERFGTIGCLVGGRAIEITTHRGEAYQAASRKPEVVYAAAIDEDLSRRDFTVNAMAVSVPDGTLIDPFGGLDDLRRSRLATPRSPSVSFSDDPLRMLRAARFVAAYGLVPDREVVEAVEAMAPRLEIVSVERRRDELDKVLAAPDAARGVDLMVRTGLAGHLLAGLSGRSPKEWQRARDRIAQVAPDVALGRAALLHRPGDDPAAAVKLARALRLSNDEVREVATLATGWEQVAVHQGAWTPEDVRRLAATAGAHLRGVLALAATTGDVAPLRRATEELEDREDLSSWTLPVDGEEVMALLGIGPGPIVGEALGWLREQWIRSGPLSRREAEDRLRSWWTRRAAVRSDPFLAGSQDQRGGEPPG